MIGTLFFEKIRHLRFLYICLFIMLFTLSFVNFSAKVEPLTKTAAPYVDTGTHRQSTGVFIQKKKESKSMCHKMRKIIYTFI